MIAAFFATSAVFSYLVPLEQTGSDETFVAPAGAVLFGSRGSQVLSAIVDPLRRNPSRLHRRDGPPPSYRTPAFPAPAVVFLGMTAFVLALLAAGSPVQSALGVAVTGLGIPVYAWLYRRRT